MVAKTRNEIPLSSSRRIVRRIYKQNGYKIITWLAGACPDTVEKTRKDAPPDYVALDLALDALSRARGKEPKRGFERNPHKEKKRFQGPAPKINRIAKLTFKA